MKKEAPENEASYFSHGLRAAISPKSDHVFGLHPVRLTPA